MKWIFYSLVLINFIYMGWENKDLFVGPESVRQPGSGVDLVETGSPLVLLTERLPQLGSPEPPPTIGTSLTELESVVVEPFIESSVDEVIEATATIEQSDIAVAVDIVRKEAADEPLNSAPTKKMLCPHIGPFDDPGAGEHFVQLLRNEGVDSQLVPVDVVKGIESWVMIPSLGSRKASLALLKELQAKKIDSYLITEGEYRNAISLGLFLKESSAKGVLEQMELEGYEAKVQVRERTSKEYWAYVRATKDGYIARETIEKLVNDQKDIKISESLCETFAQGS